MVPKKAATKTSPAKKSAPKKVNKKGSVKKRVVKKAAEKQQAPKKSFTKKPAPPAEEVVTGLPDTLGDAAPASSTCKCKQKKPNGKFFCYKLVQGRWIQSSAIPFPTKQLCEDTCC